MDILTIEQLYEQYIKPLSTGERLRLLSLISQELSALPSDKLPSPQSSLETGDVKRTIVNDNEAQESAGKLVKKGSPQAVLKLAGTLSPEEADAILKTAQECRQIDWEMWEQAG